MSEQLITGIRGRNKRSLARAITYVESGYAESEAILRNIAGYTGNAYRIGITGPPGAGKSTITNALTKFYRSSGKTVSVIAVDPTSPFTGGALLGDRVRMNDIGRDEGVFIRSMATRGSLGGLCKKAIDAADLMDAAGFDYILFESVGVGQSELDIVKAADTTIVVLVPESGDSVQAMKAGLMEIADFYVVNKSDRPGSEQAVSAIKTILMMRDHTAESWMPDILKAVGTENKGITEIASEIARHRAWLTSTGIFTRKREQQARERIRQIVEGKLTASIWERYGEETLQLQLEQVLLGKVSPYVIADEILQQSAHKA